MCHLPVVVLLFVIYHVTWGFIIVIVVFFSFLLLCTCFDIWLILFIRENKGWGCFFFHIFLWARLNNLTIVSINTKILNYYTNFKKDARNCYFVLWLFSVVVFFSLKWAFLGVLLSCLNTISLIINIYRLKFW